MRSIKCVSKVESCVRWRNVVSTVIIGHWFRAMNAYNFLRNSPSVKGVQVDKHTASMFCNGHENISRNWKINRFTSVFFYGRLLSTYYRLITVAILIKIKTVWLLFIAVCKMCFWCEHIKLNISRGSQSMKKL